MVSVRVNTKYTNHMNGERKKVRSLEYSLQAVSRYSNAIKYKQTDILGDFGFAFLRPHFAFSTEINRDLTIHFTLDVKWYIARRNRDDWCVAEQSPGQ